MRSVLSLIAGASLLAVAGCGSGGDDATAAAPAPDVPTIVVTTSMLGDVVRAVVGDHAEVDVIMPVGADPHEFAPSARQAEAMQGADLLVVNGAGLEQAMAGVIDGAVEAGTPVFSFADHADLHALAGGAAAGPDADGHVHDGADPHIWNDPHAMAGAVAAFGEQVATLDGVDGVRIRQRADEYVAQLDALDAEITATLAPIPADRRKLVTNHDAFGYFADRYDLEVIGAVIPSLTTSAGASAADLDALADLVRAEHVPAIFAETTQPTKLADALADEVGGDLAVVELFTESLGEPGSGADTYLGMMRTDAERIAAALS